MTRRGPRFAKAYTAILRDPTLSCAAVRVWLVIKSYADTNGAAYPTRQRIAGDCDLTVNSVRNALNQLHDAGVLTWDTGYYSKANTYFLQDEHYAKFRAKSAGKKRTTGAGKKRTTKKIQIENTPENVIPLAPVKSA